MKNYFFLIKKFYKKIKKLCPICATVLFKKFEKKVMSHLRHRTIYKKPQQSLKRT